MARRFHVRPPCVSRSLGRMSLRGRPARLVLGLLVAVGLVIVALVLVQASNRPTSITIPASVAAPTVGVAGNPTPSVTDAPSFEPLDRYLHGPALSLPTVTATATPTDR